MYSLGFDKALRLEFLHALYHVMSLGHRREDIFDDDDRIHGFKRQKSDGGKLRNSWQVWSSSLFEFY